MELELTNRNLQYICRESFSGGISMFTSGIYKAKEQLETAVFSFRHQLLNIGKNPHDYFFLFLYRPGVIDRPKEVMYLTSLKDFMRVDRHFYMGMETIQTSQHVVSQISDNNIFEEFFKDRHLGVKAILNTRLFSRFPQSIMSLEDCQKSFFSPWEIKFPIPKGETIDCSLSEDDLYGDLKTWAGEILAEFLGAMGKEVSQKDINWINNQLKL